MLRAGEASLLGTVSPRMPDKGEPHWEAGPGWQSPEPKGWGSPLALPRAPSSPFICLLGTPSPGW